MSHWFSKQFVTLCAVTACALLLSGCSGCSDEVGNNDEENHNDYPNNGEPIPCHSHDDCENQDHRCVLEAPGEEGECLTLFEMRQPGEECSQSRHCESGLCYDDVCAVPCDGADDCEGEQVCGTSGICEEPSVCDTDEDCGEGSVCAFTDTEEGGLETICRPHNEGAQAGESCSANGECLSRYCLDGRCTAPCDDDDQCGTLQICDEETLSIDDVEQDFQVCTEMPPIDCWSPGDCEDEALTCNTTVPESGAIQGAICGPTNPGEAALGESCTSPGDCETDLCWISDDGSAGECSVFCEDAGQDCLGGQVCTGKAAGLGMCLSECDTNADCEGGNVCQMGNDPDGNTVHSYCSLHNGDGQTGDMCSESSDCETGLCLTVVTYAVTEQSCQADQMCDSGYECRCPPEEPDCSQLTDRVCVSEEGTVEDRCTELCDPEDDGAICDEGSHDMTWCNDSIDVTVGGVSETIAACSLEREE